MAQKNIRPPAVAGLLYPDDPSALYTAITRLLSQVVSTEPALFAPKALVVPHAAYVYSGSVAASAFALVASTAETIRRVVLIGPAHRVAVSGCVLPSAESFSTPLGDIPVDQHTCRRLAAFEHVSVIDQAHAREHCLEVQLPFLQCLLPRFELIPLLVGHISPQDFASVLAELWGGAETLIVISSDLSHYLPYEVAKRIDRLTTDEILALHPQVESEQACGARAINGLLLLAQRFGLTSQLIDSCNSGDTAGDRNRVVGYASIAFYEDHNHVCTTLH